jgi:hypothetical protein
MDMNASHVKNSSNEQSRSVEQVKGDWGNQQGSRGALTSAMAASFLTLEYPRDTTEHLTEEVVVGEGVGEGGSAA